jgi:hypothetical protein
MFEEKRTLKGIKVVLPPVEHRPVSHQLTKRPPPVVIPDRPKTAVPQLSPLDRLKAIRKLERAKLKLWKCHT